MDELDPTRIRTLLGVWAHPDDEAYLSAGLMLRVARAGGRVVCLTATRGERGTDDPARWPPWKLGERRGHELTAALLHLGVHESHVLDLPDGGCEDVPGVQAIDAVAAVVDAVRPDVIVTFGPDGITGHPDHVAVGHWTTAAWSARPDPGVLLYATTTPSFVRRNRRLHRRHGMFPPGYPRPSVDADRVYDVELDAGELGHKRAALAAHASQTEALARQMGEAAFTHWWRTESFRLPRPAELGLATAASSRTVG